MIGAGVPLAHGIGSSQDLPLPLGSAVAGAAAAVLVSFAALALLWREPRLKGAEAGRPLPAGLARTLDSRAFRGGLAALGLVATAYVLLALVFGRDDADNPVPHVVYVYLWLGVVVLSVLFGPVWRQLNPGRTLHALLNRAVGLDPTRGLRPLPAGLGWWPAAAGLLGFAWLELVSPDPASLVTLRIAIALYVAVQLLAGLLYGSHWFDRGDAFEAWSGLFGRLSPLGRRADGVLVVRSPLAGPDGLPAAPGLAAVVVTMLAATVFDAIAGSLTYVSYVQSSPVPRTVFGTAGLLATSALLYAVFAAVARLAARLGGVGALRRGPATEGRAATERGDAAERRDAAERGDAAGRGDAPGRGQGFRDTPASRDPSARTRGLAGRFDPVTAFAPSLIPVALGYVVAHYYSLFALEGQRGLVKLTDPLEIGADWLGTAHLTANPAPVTPGLVVDVQVLAIVIGHVLGTVLAHDRAVRSFPRRQALLGQLPMLALMVALTCLGLFLLFAA